jgi:guanine deaminase
MPNPFMSRAFELALENIESSRGGPFAAVIVKNGKIVAEGTNRVTATNDPTAHAEIVAIRKACKRLGHFELKGCEIYTTCEPCPMCLGAIYWARPKRIYFAGTAAEASAAGFDDSFIYREFKKPRARRKIPMSQIMRNKARKVFRAWEKKQDKIPY